MAASSASHCWADRRASTDALCSNGSSDGTAPVSTPIPYCDSPLYSSFCVSIPREVRKIRMMNGWKTTDPARLVVA